MKNIILSIACLALILAAAPASAHAAFLEFDPSSVNVDVGDTFDMDIVVKVSDDEITGVDAVGDFDPSVLEVQAITDGTFLEIAHKSFDNPGRFYVAGLVNSVGESVTGEGVLATVTFKAIASGTTTVTYLCELGETGESNISESSTVDAPDLIECGLNGEGVVVVGGSSGGTSSGSSGSSGSTSGGSGGSELPKSGVFDDLLVFIVIGGVLFVIGVGAKLLA